MLSTSLFLAAEYVQLKVLFSIILLFLVVNCDIIIRYRFLSFVGDLFLKCYKKRFYNKKGQVLLLSSFVLIQMSCCTSISNLAPRRKAYSNIDSSAILKFLKYLFLLIRHCFEQIIMMPCHVFHKLFHFWGVISTVLLRNDISVPQLFYHAFHLPHILLAHNNTTENGESPDLFETNPIFSWFFLWQQRLIN